MWRGSGVGSVHGAHRGRRADGPKLAWGVRKVHAHRAATLWPGEDAVAVLDYEAEGWPPPFAELWRGPLGGQMACNTVVEDLTAAGLQDDECIEVRAVTTVKKSVANHPRVVPNEGQSPRADPEQDGFRGPGTSAAGSVRLECRASVSTPGRALIKWGSVPGG